LVELEVQYGKCMRRAPIPPTCHPPPTHIYL